MPPENPAGITQRNHKKVKLGFCFLHYSMIYMELCRRIHNFESLISLETAAFSTKRLQKEHNELLKYFTHKNIHNSKKIPQGWNELIFVSLKLPFSQIIVIIHTQSQQNGESKNICRQLMNTAPWLSNATQNATQNAAKVAFSKK